MPRLLLCAIVLALCWPLPPARASSPPELSQLGADEKALEQAARQGRLSQDELIKRGEKLSYFTKLRFYLYAKELEPFFEGVEDAFRDLARTDPADREKVLELRDKVARALKQARERLFAAGREDPERDWRRGLTGLIWLDHDWRRRVHEQGKNEIKNPYDLVALVDCLDAVLRGIMPRPPGGCPLKPAPPRRDSSQDEEDQ